MFLKLFSQLSILPRQLISPKISFHTSPINKDNFFLHLTANELWKGVTSVSSAGKKRGRGKGRNRRMIRDLNRGQVIGVGRKNMLWPGLNAPVTEGKQMLKLKELPLDPEREKRLHELRDRMNKFRPLKISALERGWSGGIMGGRKLGPPDRTADYDFSAFDSRVLKMRIVCHMTGTMGRMRNYSCIVITGNHNGLVGWAFGKSPEAKVALRKAKNRAVKHLVYVERHDNRTIYHPLYGTDHATKVYMFSRPPGTGIIGHRVIKSICEVVGIKDIYAKVEGAFKNYHNLTRCVIQMLAKQETYQQLSDRVRLHVVELSPEREFLPVVLASPKPPLTTRLASEIDTTRETLDFEDIYTDGKLFKHGHRKSTVYADLPTFAKYQQIQRRSRNMEDLAVKMYANEEITGQPPHPLTAADVEEIKRKHMASQNPSSD